MIAVQMIMVALQAMVVFFLILVSIFPIFHHEYVARYLACKMHSINDFLNT